MRQKENNLLYSDLSLATNTRQAPTWSSHSYFPKPFHVSYTIVVYNWNLLFDMNQFIQRKISPKLYQEEI